MARVTIYKNSVLASICSLAGYGMAMIGLVTLFDGEIAGGIILIVLGILLAIFASMISDNKQFITWKKKIEANGVDHAIRSSIEVAIQAYNSYPGKKTLNYIQTLNPAAAEIISSYLATKKTSK